jgi:hypothetical protein
MEAQKITPGTEVKAKIIRKALRHGPLAAMNKRRYAASHSVFSFLSCSQRHGSVKGRERIKTRDF